jgi:hypothetical protein
MASNFGTNLQAKTTNSHAGKQKNANSQGKLQVDGSQVSRLKFAFKQISCWSKKQLRWWKNWVYRWKNFNSLTTPWQLGP